MTLANKTAGNLPAWAAVAVSLMLPIMSAAVAWGASRATVRHIEGDVAQIKDDLEETRVAIVSSREALIRIHCKLEPKTCLR